MLPSLFTLVPCSLPFHLPGPICSFTGGCLTAHPSFCLVPYSGFNVFSQGSQPVLLSWGRRSVLQDCEFKQQEKQPGSLQSQYSNVALWYDVLFKTIFFLQLRHNTLIQLNEMKIQNTAKR